jgi:hypothetical protein
MPKRAAAVDSTPKCGRCGGWALEPDVYPAAGCTACGGTGRPPPPPPPPPQQELIDG